VTLRILNELTDEQMVKGEQATVGVTGMRAQMRLNARLAGSSRCTATGC
jgi:hypothetical protein